MATNRKFILANDHFYHVFNRGVEKRIIFSNRRDYKRALETAKYYQYQNLPCRFSKFLEFNTDTRNSLYQSIISNNKRLVDIVAYCFMPNHFHFLLKQNTTKGISTFIANFTNSYTKFFNTKYERDGHLFQGVFKAVLIEEDSQLIHLSRYIHINPVVSLLIDITSLGSYEFSSYHEYISPDQEGLCIKDMILGNFRNTEDYKSFVLDQVSYAQELSKIKHLLIEE